MIRLFSSEPEKRVETHLDQEHSLIDTLDRMTEGQLWKVTLPSKGQYLISGQKEKSNIEVGSKWPFPDGSLSAIMLQDVTEADMNIEALASEISRVLSPDGICLSLQLDAMQPVSKQAGHPQGIPPSTLVMAFESTGLFSRYDFLIDSGRFAVLSSQSKEKLNRYGKELCFRQPLPVVSCEEDQINVLPMAGIRFENTKLILGENATLHLFNRSFDCMELNIFFDIEEVSTETAGVIFLNHFPCFYREALRGGPLIIDEIMVPPGGSQLRWQGPELHVKEMRIEAFRVNATQFCEWLPFDQYQRYWTITEAVKRAVKTSPRRILDIGGYPGLTQPFLPGDDIWVSDISPCDRPHYVRVVDVNLPFEDRFFDAVISTDTLEHIQREDRWKAVKEMVRVSKETVILGFPFEEGPAPFVDRLLDEYHRVELGVDFPFLREHIELGLPSRQETIRWLEEMGLLVMNIPNAYAPTFLPMMRQEFFFLNQPKRHRMFREWNKYYNRQFVQHDNREPAYRCILVAGREKISFDDLLARGSDIHQTIPIL
jgi:ubiquinone/menaquinone biosynthesis C-methylase UbiE